MSLYEKARELYNLCDTEDRGYLERSDLHQLQQYLPLTADQLDDVFDRLDNNGDGRLTLTEFTSGFGRFIGQNDESDKFNPPEEETEELFKQTLWQTGAEGLVEDIDTVHDIWAQLRRENPVILPEFEKLLSRIAGEMKQAKTEYQNLEMAFRVRTTAHDEEVQRLYEEMESQLKNERECLLQQERERERQLRLDLEAEIREKDKIAQEIMQQHEETQRRLDQLMQMHAETSLEKEQLGAERLELEKKLAESELGLEECQEYIEALNKKSKEDRVRRAQAAIELTEGIALERESLVRQLIQLREINKHLKDEQDEKWLKRSSYAKESEIDQGEILYDYADGNGSGDISNRLRSQRVSHGGQTAQVSMLSRHLVQQQSRRSSEESTGPVSPGGFDLSNPSASRSGDSSRTGTSHLSLSKTELVRRGSTLGTYFQNARPGIQNFDESEEVEGLESDLYNNSHLSRPGRLPSIAFQDNGEEWAASSTTNLEVSSDYCDAGRTNADNVKRRHSSEILRGQRPSPDGAHNQEIHNESPNTNKDPQRIYKVVFVGDSNVGKSSIIHMVMDGKFSETISSTVGIDFRVKTLVCEGIIVVLQLWDTAGQERFRSFTKSYFRRADAVVVMYDCMQEKSYLNLRSWLFDVQESTNGEAVLLFLANKQDLVDSANGKLPVISNEKGKSLAKEYQGHFYPVSAKTGENVNDAFIALSRILKEREDLVINNPLPVLVELHKRKKPCCN